MTEGATPGRFGTWRAALLLGVVLTLSGLNSALPSFQSAAALAKLAMGLANLTAIGWATSQLLELKVPRHFAIATQLLLGQVVALGYVYLRSALCSAAGLPGLSILEVMLVEGALVWFAWERRSPESSSSMRMRMRIGWNPQHLRSQFFVLIAYLFWLSWLAYIAFQKLDLLYTPSSDPDIHAFYAKILLARGHLFYDLMPVSDAWMVYPSGFSCLGLVLALLSGLHPVQVVNIEPYLQFTLFCGAAFAVMCPSIARSRQLAGLSLLHFGLAYLCFNAVFAPSRAMLEGTPRLAHSALLFFPLFFVLQNAKRTGRRPLLLALPLCAVVTGICINPTHAPAAGLFGAVAIVFFFADRNSRRSTPGVAFKGEATLRWLKILVVLATLFVVMLSTDPFYRSLFFQQSAPAGQIELARDLTGDALSSDFDLAKVMRQALMRSPAGLLVDPGGAEETVPVQIAALLGLLLCVVAVSVAGKFRSRVLSPGGHRSLRLAMAAFACLALHALWCEVSQQLVRPDVLQGALWVRYTRSLQDQIGILFFAICITALAITVFVEGAGEAKSPGHRLAAGLFALGIALASLAILGPAALAQARAYYPKLRQTSLGRVYPSDLAFIKRARERLGEEERVLLPGRLVRRTNEDWIFTTDAGRAVPLFSDIRTSFFLGLDGESFTAGAYRAHVKSPNFDPVWLQSQNVLWLIESGNFPVRILAQYYERVFGNDHAVLWRLRRQTP